MCGVGEVVEVDAKTARKSCGRRRHGDGVRLDVAAVIEASLLSTDSLKMTKFRRKQKRTESKTEEDDDGAAVADDSVID